MRESLLLSDLDKLRNQKADALRFSSLLPDVDITLDSTPIQADALRLGAQSCRECIESMQSFMGGVVRLMDTEQVRC
jgi:hypothetical protein